MLDDVELLFQPPPGGPRRGIWFLFLRGELLVSEDPDQPVLPEAETAAQLGLQDVRPRYVGRAHGIDCWTLALTPEQVPAGFYPLPLRRVLGLLSAPLMTLAGRAAQLLTWHEDHRFCSRCGTRTRPHPREHARVCPACDYTQYPRISPCIIALVTRGDEILLARNARFPARTFSCIAGFIEAGESAEQAVHREVMEEVGVAVGRLEYFTSQSWPFPHSLMLGFLAEYRSGEIQVDGEEIVEAEWWRADQLPPIPAPGTIARALIEHWLRRPDTDRPA